MTELKIDAELDTQGLKCPMPMLKTKKALAKMEKGQILKILATDPHAETDLKQFSEQTGHVFLSSEKSPDGVYTILMGHK